MIGLTLTLVGMLLPMFLGVPIAVSMGIAASVGLLLFASTTPVVVIAQQLVISLDSFPIVAIPLFMLAGAIMEVGGLSRRMLNVAQALVGNLPGGLAAACVVTCLFFGAVSGSSIATTFAIGAILIPAMIRQGYPVGFSAALQATSAELAVIIPPSIPMILYGISANTSIGDLFLAGIGPGILIAGMLLVAVVLWSMLRGYKSAEHAPPLFRSLLEAAPALMLPFLILGGIYGGIVTPTEAAVIAVFATLTISTFVYREMTWEKLFGVFRRTAVTSSTILILVACAGLFSYQIQISGVGSTIVDWLSASFTSPLTFLLAVNLALLVIGMFVETGVSILVLAPLLAPVAVGLGIDPVHMGIVMIVNLAIGMLTPPLGVNLFAACTVAKVPIQTVIPYLLPLVGLLVAALAVITYVPAISVGLLAVLK